MDILKNTLVILSKELDANTIVDAKQFLELEYNSDSFLRELDIYMSSYKSQNDENKERDNKIAILILLGLGRNRTIEILKDYKVTRKTFEDVRDKSGLNKNKRKQSNEKVITSFKSEASARDKRNKKLSNVDWDSIVNEYLNGSSPAELGKLYNVSSHYIKLKLIDDNLFDYTRSTITKNKIATEKIYKVDDNYIINLVKNNPLDSKDLWWEKSKKKYPWILRHQFYNILTELNLNRTFDEINEVRSIKSKTETNDAYMVKFNGYKSAKEVFGSIDNLVGLYMDNSLGSFNKIADKINREIDFDYEITPRQVSKIITGHSTYRRSKSLGQQQLYRFIKDSFPNHSVCEEYLWGDSQKKIDVYIPDLKLGFEFNGEYWHSDVVLQYNYGKTAKELHSERVEDLLDYGIKLLFVWEDDWTQNYKEVEEALMNKDWDAKILNKLENTVKRSGEFWSPNKQPSLLRKQVIRFLKDKKVGYIKKNNSHLIELKEHNIVINIPNYNSLSNKKETLNLQKDYEAIGIELLTFLPWRNIFKIKEFLMYRLKLSSVKRISARKCNIVFNDGINKSQREFFAKNHLLGYNTFKGIEKTITLEYNGETVIAGLFLRDSNSKSVELKRLVSTYGVAVQGGASRILKEYIRQNTTATEMFTYSDADLGFGGVYSVLGFDNYFRSKEQLSWYNESLEMSFSNLSLVKQGSDRLLRNIPNYEPIGVGEGLPSNQEIVQAYGFIPIYDSGYKKWSLNISNVNAE